ncbi:MAG: sensor histidine kinase [Oligoflexus sp.]
MSQLRKLCSLNGPYILIWVIGSLLALPPLHATEHHLYEINLDEAETVYDINNFRLYEDFSGKLTIQQILDEYFPQRFRPATPEDIPQEFTLSHYWLMLAVKNNTANQHDWFVSAQYPMIQMQMYQLHFNETTGELTTKEVKNSFSATQINLAAGEDATYLIEVQSNHIIDLHFRIMSEDNYHQKDKKEMIVKAIVSGCFIAMILYNFFLYLSLRDSNYLYYLMFAIFNSHIGLLAVKFPGDIFTWFGLDWWTFIDYYRFLGPLTTFLFARSFLQTRQNHPFVDKVLLSYMAGTILLMILHLLLPPNFLFESVNNYLLLGIIILLFAGFYSFKKGFKPAKYFLLAIGCFLLGLIVYLTSLLGLIPRNALTLNAHLVSQAAEMFLMSLALAGKIKILQKDKIQAELTSHIKSRLLKVISHDIANPLTVVKGVAHLLASDESKKIYIERLMRSVKMIEDIMRFVLKTESLDKGDVLSVEPVALKAVFEDLFFLFQEKALEKGIKLQFELENPQLYVLAEKTCLTNEILGNLISNAIKFSYPGSSVKIQAKRHLLREVSISVTDQGVGIDSQTIHRLFDPILNRSRRGTQSEGGAGYGLPLAKAFVATFGGSIEVESRSMDEFESECGTIFRVILPLVEPESMA